MASRRRQQAMPATRTGTAVSGLGRGMMQGLELSRRHQREDEEMERARERDRLRRERIQQQMELRERQDQRQSELHDPQLDRAETQAEMAGLNLSHQQAMRPLEREQAEQAVRQGELQLSQAEIENQAMQTARDARVAMRAARAGDWDAVAGWYSNYAPNEVQIDPAPDGENLVLTYSEGDAEQITPNELMHRIGELANPESVFEQMAAQNELEPDSHSDLRQEYDMLYGPPSEAEVQALLAQGDDGQALMERMEQFRNRPSFREYAAARGVRVPDVQGQDDGGGERAPVEQAVDTIEQMAIEGSLDRESWESFRRQYPEAAPRVAEGLRRMRIDVDQLPSSNDMDEVGDRAPGFQNTGDEVMERLRQRQRGEDDWPVEEGLMLHRS